MSVLNKLIPVACISTIAVAHCVAESAWLPQVGSYSLTLSYTQESYDMFWLGEADQATSADSKQVTYGLTGEYGLSDKIAFDAYIGYAKNEFGHPSGAFLTDSGIADIELGLRYLLVDETEHAPGVPTVTARLGLIIAGNYDHYPYVAAPQSAAAIGDGSNGYELQVLLAKYYQDVGIGYTADLGYRDRNHDVPNDIFYSLGVFYSYEEKITVGFDYIVNDSRGDLDISSPTFAGRFPQLEEDVKEWMLSFSYAFEEKYSTGIVYGDTADGRNTPQNDIFGIWVSADF
ncbi:MAG: hypothetical protein HRU15_07205 [Planctomycetes bacterium]|nr:hypothetical protein [Planctomycetota bacterium]